MKTLSRRDFLRGTAAGMAGATLSGILGGGFALSAFADEDTESSVFPLAETATLTGMISYPANTESEPNNRTIFKRLQEKTNVQIECTAIQSDQWRDKITLNMSNKKTLTDFVFSAGFSDSDLLRYADQGAILALEDYIDAYMPKELSRNNLIISFHADE